ncbi:MAG: hypothetical protein ACYSWW_11605 [Planctomycetota bacterium]
MKSPITKLGAAAAVIIVVLAGIHFSGGSFDGSTVAWGEVLRNVERIHTIQYRETVIGSEEKTTIVSISPEYGLKEECYKNGKISSIACYQKPERMLVAVLPLAKAYERRPLTERELRIVHTKRDGAYYVRKFMSVEHKQLGRANINGVEVEGIEIDSAEPFEPIPAVDSFVGRLWVDVANNLPVLVELEFVPAGSTVQTKVVMDEIQWNVELSKSNFELDIPADCEALQ